MIRPEKYAVICYRIGLFAPCPLPPVSDQIADIAGDPVRAISEHIQLDCGPDPTSPALRASSASFVKIFFPAMRPDSQAPVI